MTTSPDPQNLPADGAGQGTGNLSDSLPPELLEPQTQASAPRTSPAGSAPTGTPPTGGPSTGAHERNSHDHAGHELTAPARTAPARTAPVAEADTKGGLSGGVWVSLILGAIITILLLVFIIQNNTASQFQYFGWSFSLPLGVAMLLAAIAGVLVAGIIGSVRIFILSRRLKKVQKAIGG